MLRNSKHRSDLLFDPCFVTVCQHRAFFFVVASHLRFCRGTRRGGCPLFAFVCGRLSTPPREKSADCFFATEVEGHEDLHSDPSAAMAELLDAHHLTEGFTIDGAGAIRIGTGNKHAHSLFVSLVLGDEIDAVTGRVNGWQDLIKIEKARIRGSDAHRLCESQT